MVRVLGFSLSIAILLWLLHVASVENVAASLPNASFTALLFTILLGYLAFPLRVEQWRLLLGMPRSVTHWKTLKATCLGHVGNVLLPMRGGEAVRAVLLSRSCAVPLPRVLVSVGLNHAYSVTILLIVAAVFVLSPLDPATIEAVSKVLGVSFTPTQADLTGVMRALGASIALAALGLCLAYFYWRPALHLATRLTANYNFPGSQRLIRVLDNLGEGMEVVGQSRYFWTAQALSFACWFIFLVSPIPLLAEQGQTPCFAAEIGISACKASAKDGVSPTVPPTPPSPTPSCPTS